MRISLPDDRIRVDGAVALDADHEQVRAHRLDPSLGDQFAVETGFIESMPSGVRLVFTTDAAEIAVHCTPLRFQLTDGERTQPPYAATFELLVGGELVDSAAADFGPVVVVDRSAGDFELVAGSKGVLRLDGAASAGAPRAVELWLPQSANVELHAIEVPDGSMVSAAPPDHRPRWLHYGSSISHCLEATGPSRTWPAVAASLTGQHLINLGLAAQCHIDQFAARTIRDVDADRVSLKLGINVANGDTMKERTFLPAVHGFLDTIRERRPAVPILVISPIFCGALEDVPGPSRLAADGKVESVGGEEMLAFGGLSLRKMREMLAEVVEKRTARGDTNLTYLDGLELFGEADAPDLPDGLHPSPEGYVRIGERFARHEFLAGGGTPA